MNIQSEITNYLNHPETNGALLITGQWGSGKSHCIHKAAEELNKEFAIACISLFGIDSVSGLEKRIQEEYVEKTSIYLGKKAKTIHKEILSAIKKGSELVSTAFPASVEAAVVSKSLTAISAFSPLSLIQVKNTLPNDERKFVLFLDDFERCTIDTKTLMGFINEYIENKKIKTVLVADEEKIKEEETYAEFKEKVVFSTIRLQQDAKGALDEILNSYSANTDGYKDFLNQNFHTILAIYKDSQLENLRTIKSILVKFERVFAAYKKSQAPENHLVDILYAFGVISNESHANHFINDGLIYRFYHDSGSEEAKKIEEKYPSGILQDLPNTLKKWIVEGIWNEDCFIKEINDRYVLKELTPKETILAYRFWDLDQSTIEKGLPALLQDAYDGKLSGDQLIRLLIVLHCIEKHHIATVENVDYTLMHTGFKKWIQDNKGGDPKKFRISVDCSIDLTEKAKKILSTIRDSEELSYKWHNESQLNAYLNGTGDISRYEIQNFSVESFTDDLFDSFCNSFFISKNMRKRELCFVLLRIFKNMDIEARKKSKKNLQRLIAELTSRQASETDGITRAIEEDLKDKLRAFEKE
ncbi:MAG: hypothetical protein IJB19_00570 [Clostridia bacterium]|nr:hypothetical protein [Clostridia bacterium]